MRAFARILIITGCLVGGVASAQLPFTARWSSGLSWVDQPVRAPVDPQKVEGTAPYVPALTPETSGEVEVGPHRAAAFWLWPLDIVQVHGNGALHFERVVGEREPGASFVRIEEAGIPARQGLWYLAEPIGEGSVWVITADKPVRIQVQKPEPVEDALAGEGLRQDVLAWIEGRGALPPLPLNGNVRDRLELDAELAQALLEGETHGTSLRTAVIAWRKASALHALATLERPDPELDRIEWPKPPCSGITFDGFVEPFIRPSGDQGEWRTTISGPGVFDLEVRPLLPQADAQSSASGPVQIEITRNGAIVEANEAITPLPASVGPPSALPLSIQPRTLDSGEVVGREQELRVVVPPGDHTYSVRWSNGPVLLRAAVAQRRAWFSDAVLNGTADWDGWAKRAWAESVRLPPLQASVLRARLAELDPSLGPVPELSDAQLTAKGSPRLSAIAAADAVEHGASPQRARDLLNRAIDGLSQHWPAGSENLAWSVRLRVAEQLSKLGDAVAARDLLRSAPEFPRAASLAAKAAALVATLPQGDPLRSRSLAALELAWRADPLSEDVKTQYRAAWAASARWLSLSPDRSKGPNPRPARWLDVATEQVTGSAGPTAHGLVLLEPGQQVDLIGADREAAALLRAYVTQPQPASRPATLVVGDLRVPIFPTSTVEPIEIALPHGRFTARLEAPTGTRAWLSVPTPIPSKAGRLAYVRTAWPARDGHELTRFALPDSQLPSPIRVQLRAPGSDGPMDVWVRTDVGAAFRMTLIPGAPSLDHVALDESRGASESAASAVLYVPPFTRELRFDADDHQHPLFVSVSVRRDNLPELPPRAPNASLETPSPDELLSLSREIARGQDVAPSLLRRAQLLLGAGEEGLAREDLSRVMAQQSTLSSESSAALLSSLDKLDALDSDGPGFVRFHMPLKAPVLLSPGYAAVANSREDQSRYAQARAAYASEHFDEAALALIQIYERIRKPELATEALEALGRVDPSSKSWRDWGAPIGSTLCDRLDSWADLPEARHVRFVAKRWARWQSVRDAETQVGTLSLADTAPHDDLSELIRKALVAAPWSLRETRLLPPDRAAVLQLQASTHQRVGVEALCGSYRGVHPDGQPCAFTLRVDGKTVAEASAAFGQVVSLTAELSRGRHQIELHHGESDAPVVAAVRFVGFDGDSPAPLSVPEPVSTLRARPDQPVSVTVLGPTAVRIRARTFNADGPRSLRVKDGDREALVLPLSDQVDPDIIGAPAPVGQQTEGAIVLAEPGPHHLTFESADGEALVHLAMGRSERPSDAQPRWWSRTATAVEPLPWPALPRRFALLPEADGQANKMRDLGTLSAELGYLGDDLDEGEVQERLESALELRLGYRQELSPRRAWLLVEPIARVPFGLSPVLGGSTTVHLRRLPLGLRFAASGALYSQQAAGTQYFSARVRLSADRFFRIAPDLGLIPGIGFTAETMPTPRRADRVLLDPLVYWQYGEEHPLRASPRLTLRWTPLLDEVGELSAWTSSNPDLASLDHASARIGWTTLFRRVGGARAALWYEASWRMQVALRSEAYLRHGANGYLDLGIWTGREGRLLLFAQDQAWISGPYGFQNLVSAGVRWDWTGGRGLRDILPFEEEFEQLLDASHRER